MTTPLVEINDEPITIQSIEPARQIDDSSTRDQLTVSRLFYVYTNDTKTELSVFDVITAEPSFRPGAIFGNRKVNSVRLRETASNAIYEFEVEFIFTELKTPFLVPIDWQWESTTLEVPAYTDAKGRPTVTTAGEPIAGLKRNVKLWILRGTRNVPGVPKWFRDYGISVNSDNVKADGEAFAKNHLQAQRFSLGGYEEQEIEGVTYRFRPLSFELWFNPLSWSSQVLNLGYYELQVRKFTDEFGKIRTETWQVRTTDGAGEDTKDRVFLDKNGRRPRDAYGNPKTSLEPSELYTLKFDLDDALPYSVFLK